MRHLFPLLIGALLCLSPAARAQTAEDYPDDPTGAVVVDRDSLEMDGRSFYAVLYTQGQQSYLDVYQGLPWQRVHRWPIEFQNEKVVVPSRSTLHIDKGDDDVVSFFWNSYAGYREGNVHMALLHDLKSGTWKTSWSD